MPRSDRPVIALLVAPAVLFLAGWFDRNVVRDVVQTFDTDRLLALPLGSLAVAGSVLLLGVLAWRSHSALVGATYALVGAYLAFQPVIVRLAAQINDTPPMLPQPIAQAVSWIYFWSFGPLNAVNTIGAGMLLVGVLVVGRSFQRRSVGRASAPMAGIDGQPIRP